MNVGYEKVDIYVLSALFKVVAERSDTRTGINNYLFPTLEVDFQAGGISTIDDCIFARNWGRTPGTPKFDSHLFP